MTRQLSGVLGYCALFAILLFIPARTIDWPAAWILLATLLTVRSVSTVKLWKTQRQLLEARSSLPLPKEGQPATDRILLPLCMATFAALPVLASMDVWHWHLVPFRLASLRWIGLAAFAGGWWIVHVALRENAFALTVVRHQHERKQTVITSGPYSIVRHPMYSGLLILMPGLGVWLGSLIAAAASLIPITILATRIIFEERLLCAHLPEYKSYAEVTRSRLLPGIW